MSLNKKETDEKQIKIDDEWRKFRGLQQYIPWVAAMTALEYSKERQVSTLKNLKHNEVLKILGEVIETSITKLKKDQNSVKRYDEPNWALKQADYTGAKRSFNALKCLLP